MMTTTIRRSALLLAGLAALAPAGRAAAQDIEALAAARGIRLPDAYYEAVRRDPNLYEFRQAWLHRGPAGAPAGRGGVRAAVLPNRGEMRMAVVMTLFADSPPPPFSTEVTHQQLFGANPLGNLTAFYREISGGRVSVTGNVLPWVRTGLTVSETVGSTMGLGGNARMGDYLVSALTRVDSSVNFAQYDNDGADGIPNSGDDDGFVDITVFQYTEVAAACGAQGQGPWPHRSTVRGQRGGQPYRTDDLRPNGQPVLVDDYLVQSVVDCDGRPQSISVIAHETGHAFGLPDYYDPTGGILPSQRRWVLGCWTLMAAGSWGCGNGATMGTTITPSHMGAYEKAQLGWITLAEAAVEPLQQFTLLPVQTSGRVLQVPLRGPEEYLLLEYRPNTGYDAGLPAGGVLVYHVEPSRPLRPCATCERIYRVGLLEADGDGALIRTAQEGGNRGVAGDVFTGTRVLNDGTSPSLRLNSGARSNVALSLTVSGGEARVQVFRRAPVPQEALLGPLLGGSAAPTEAQLRALDALGNANGRYDLGDLRAHQRGVVTLAN